MWTIFTCIVKWYGLFYDDRENKLVRIGPRYRGAVVNAQALELSVVPLPARPELPLMLSGGRSVKKGAAA